MLALSRALQYLSSYPEFRDTSTMSGQKDGNIHANKEVETGESKKVRHVQILHQYVQHLRTPFAGPYSLQQRRHLTRLDPLQDLRNGLQMRLLDSLIASVRRALQRTPQRALGIAAAQQLPDLLAERDDLGLRDGGECGVQRGGVEVGRGVRVERVDVYRAPVFREGLGGVVLYDGHFELRLGEGVLKVGSVVYVVVGGGEGGGKERAGVPWYVARSTDRGVCVLLVYSNPLLLVVLLTQSNRGVVVLLCLLSIAALFTPPLRPSHTRHLALSLIRLVTQSYLTISSTSNFTPQA
jgi:hypothetical protein